jgi:hypothetical protein
MEKPGREAGLLLCAGREPFGGKQKSPGSGRAFDQR